MYYYQPMRGTQNHEIWCLRRVEPASKVVERDVARRLPERRAVAHGRHRVEVRYEHEHVLALRLKVEHGLHRAEVVAPVQRA